MRNLASSSEEGMPKPDATIAEWRIAYAQLGIYTFLVYGVDKNGRCGCKSPRCKSTGKHPILSGADRGATLNTKRIRAQERQYGSSNIGIHLGLSGLVCIDVDPRHGGHKTFAALEKRHGAINTTEVVPPGWTVWRPS